MKRAFPNKKSLCESFVEDIITYRVPFYLLRGVFFNYNCCSLQIVNELHGVGIG